MTGGPRNATKPHHSTDLRLHLLVKGGHKRLLRVKEEGAGDGGANFI